MPRKTATVCKSPHCNRLTRRYNRLCVRHRNDKKLIKCILNDPTLDRQPDIYIDIRIPNEFETYGKYTIEAVPVEIINSLQCLIYHITSCI